MTAGFAFDAAHSFRDGFGVDMVCFAAVPTGDLQDSGLGRRRCLRLIRPKRYGISAGFALGGGHSAGNPALVHVVDFFTFRTGDLHANYLIYSRRYPIFQASVFMDSISV